MQGGAACGRIEGADPPTLAKRVQELANEKAAQQKAKGDGVEGMQPELKAKLKSIIGCVQVTSSEVVDGDVTSVCGVRSYIGNGGSKRMDTAWGVVANVRSTHTP